MTTEHKPHISRLIESGDRVTPIFRKTGTIMLGADAFSRAEDIEQAVYYELPRLVEQFEAQQKTLDLVRAMVAEKGVDPADLAHELEKVLGISNPAKERP